MSHQSPAKYKRILLVDGYLREHEKFLRLSSTISSSINSVMLEYQFILVDNWHEKMTNPDALI